MRRWAISTACLCLVTSLVWSQATSRPAAGASTQPASTRAATRSVVTPTAKPEDLGTPEGQEYYDKVSSAYLGSNLAELAELLKAQPQYHTKLSRPQRVELTYIRRTAPAFRPPWWKACSSTSNTSFQASIWGRNFTANYMPLNNLGEQAAFIKNGKIVVIVTWRPSMVDSAKEAEGELAAKYGLTRGDIGEVIVWHELGHNYITNFLPPRHVIELYDNYLALFSTLQEFYADMTALYHCSPRARLVAMMLRLNDIASGREMEEHARASYGIGAFILAEALSNPSAWPSFHFPGKVPDKNVERSTIVYMYEHIDPKWTLAEDKALRELVHKFIRTQGERVLRSKGQIGLCNKLTMRLMEPDDREAVAKRDEWVAAQLEKLSKDGRTDKPDADSRPASRSRGYDRLIIPME